MDGEGNAEAQAARARWKRAIREEMSAPEYFRRKADILTNHEVKLRTKSQWDASVEAASTNVRVDFIEPPTFIGAAGATAEQLFPDYKCIRNLQLAAGQETLSATSVDRLDWKSWLLDLRNAISRSCSAIQETQASLH